jgi:hypothetical protein
MDRLRLEARPDADARCPYCLDTLAQPTRACAHCATVLHAACRADLGRCPTTGCAAAVARPSPTPPSRRAAPTPVHAPALDRSLDELARRIATRPVRASAGSGGLAEARKVLFALVLSLPLVMVVVKLVLGAHAYFVAQGLSVKLAGTATYVLVLVVLMPLGELIRRLWPRADRPDL